VASGVQLIASGTGAIDVRVSKSVIAGGRLQTQNGNMTVEANRQATATSGAFTGVGISGGTIQTTGTGNISIKGTGGAGDFTNNFGDAGTCCASPVPCTVTVGVTTLETPPAQAQGGGYNSTLSAGTVTLDSPLAVGQSVNLQFVLGVVQGGTFRLYLNIEAEDDAPVPDRPTLKPGRR